MKINSVVVCGAGTMGSGIAQLSAAAAFNTVLYELNAEVLDKAKLSIKKNLRMAVEKGKLAEEEIVVIYDRINFTSNLRDCIGDLVIEAVIERSEIKITLFNQLAALNHTETIFASNTSSLPISALSEKIEHPERVAGLHFFNPAPLMKLVEVVKGDQTSAQVITALLSFSKQVGKTPVICRDAPGFIVNRVARPFYIEALRLAEEGVIEYPVIDRLMESYGFKLGPFKLMDLIGNDINYAVSCSVYDQLQKPERLKPSYLQLEKVNKADLGKKTGKGYYEYS